MRSAFAGLVVALGVLCSAAYGQNAQPAVAPRQPPGQPPRQPVQPPITAQPGQPGAVQPGQPGIVQPAQPRLAQPGQPSRQGGQFASADQEVAAAIFGHCHNEVEIAKFAQAKLKSAEARAFAEKMVSDHTPDCETYQRWSGKQAVSTALKPDDDTPATQPVGPQGGRLAAAPGGGADWNAIHE